MICQARSVSAIVQAWAMHPHGVCGDCSSKISARVPIGRGVSVDFFKNVDFLGEAVYCGESRSFIFWLLAFFQCNGELIFIQIMNFFAVNMKGRPIHF